ncbi:MAG: hypothetical protein CME89_05385 [Hirschia sp.]|nr:hypothetical protein [Hirschia sp.]
MRVSLRHGLGQSLNARSVTRKRDKGKRSCGKYPTYFNFTRNCVGSHAEYALNRFSEESHVASDAETGGETP